MKFQIENIVENGDGTCNVEYDYDQEYEDFVKKQIMLENGGNEPSVEELEAFLAEAVQKAVDKKKLELQEQESEEEQKD